MSLINTFFFFSLKMSILLSLIFYPDDIKQLIRRRVPNIIHIWGDNDYSLRRSTALAAGNIPEMRN